MRSFVIMTLISILSAFAVYYYGIDISYADIKDYCSVLIMLSGMIFTIMGIWIAFIYPNAIKKLSDPNRIETADFSETLNDTRRLESIVNSVMSSGFVAVVIAALFFMKIIFSSFASIPAFRELMMTSAFGVVVFITLLQFRSVWSVLRANYLFIEELHHKREVQERRNDF